ALPAHRRTEGTFPARRPESSCRRRRCLPSRSKCLCLSAAYGQDREHPRKTTKLKSKVRTPEQLGGIQSRSIGNQLDSRSKGVANLYDLESTRTISSAW